MTLVSREMRAGGRALAPERPSKPERQRVSASAVLPGARISRPARVGPQPDGPAGELRGSAIEPQRGVDAATTTQAGGVECAPPATSSLAQPPAHSGAGGLGRSSEAGREEPEAGMNALAAVEGIGAWT